MCRVDASKRRLCTNEIASVLLWLKNLEFVLALSRTGAFFRPPPSPTARPIFLRAEEEGARAILPAGVQKLAQD